MAAYNGTVYVSNTKDNVVAAVSGGNTTLVAGSYEGYGEHGDGGLAANATLYQPVGLAYDPTTDDLFIADSGDNVVRQVNTTTGVITLFAGDGTAGDTGNGGSATAAELDQPQGLALDANGDCSSPTRTTTRSARSPRTGSSTTSPVTGPPATPATAALPPQPS